MTDIENTNGASENLPATSKGAEMMRFASTLAKADIIPDAFRNKPANCFIALDMAQRMNVGVMEIMQNLYVVHGTPGFSAKYGIAMAARSGIFKGGIHFDWTPTPIPSVTAWAIIAETDTRVEFTCDMIMAKAEKWDRNPKYKTMPQLMLSYRSSAILIRLHAPSALLGMHTDEELQTMPAAMELPQADDPIAKRNAVLEAVAEEPEPEPEPQKKKTTKKKVEEKQSEDPKMGPDIFGDPAI